MASFFPIDEYSFHPKENTNGVYERRLFGLEALSSCMMEDLNGFTHLTTSASVAIPGNPSVDVLKPAFNDAWIFFRQALPSIAVRSTRNSDNGFALTYAVPQSPEEAATWAKETLFFNEKADTLYAAHAKLKDTLFWAPSASHYVMELHVSPVGQDLALNFVIQHNAIDGRTAFLIVESFLQVLTKVLDKSAGSPSDIQWGAEVSRLPPPAPFVNSLNGTGQPPALVMPEPAPAPPPGAMIPFIVPPPARGAQDAQDVTRLTTLNKETTAKLHALAKEKGRTITQVVVAISALAHTEAVIKQAVEVGDERFAMVAGAYGMATHYMVPFNFVNHHSKLEGYNKFDSPNGLALIAIDGMPVVASFEPVKKLVQLDAESKTVTRTFDESAFWSLAEEVAGGLKSIDTSLDAWLGREIEKEAAAKAFTPELFGIAALLTSSLGDMERLNLLKDFTPEAAKGIVVKDIVSGIRQRAGTFFNLFWQYDGRAQFHWHSAGSTNTPADMKRVTDIFEERINTLLGTTGGSSTVSNQ